MRPAFVTGGSSGIGLASALQLASRGHDIALFARDPVRLAQARDAINAAAPDVRVAEYAVDVSDRDAIYAAVADAVATLGPPEMAIASAGIATPGLFTEQSIGQHERHMAINYFGTLYFTHAITPHMHTAGGGRIGLIASGAAFFGIYGYGAYAPSKFALRALAEILNLELAAQEISVTLIYPPDTQTPQLEEEKRTKPQATQEITEGGGLWQAEDIAARLLEGMDRQKHVVTPGFQMWALNHLTSLLSPLLRWHQKRIIRKYRS